MANQLMTNPIVIDTASASDLRSGWLFVAALSWSGYTPGSNDRLIIQDGRTMSDNSGPTTLFDVTALPGGDPIELSPGQNIKICNLRVTQIDSGRLTLWLM